MRKIGVLVLTAVLTAAPAAAAISIKMTGGLTYLFGNEYNSAVRGTYDFLNANYESVTGSFKSFSLGGTGAVEVIVPIEESLGLGFGAGFFRIAAKNNFDYTWWVYSGSESFEPKLTVVPLTLNLHYQLPLGKILNVDLFGGAGGYLMRFETKSASTSDFFAYHKENTFVAQKMILGLQAGVALELELTPHIAVVLQSEARLAKATYLQGDWTNVESLSQGTSREEGKNGFFWAYNITDVSGTFPQAAFSAAGPTDSSFSSIHKGTLDISGVTAAAGLKITF